MTNQLKPVATHLSKISAQLSQQGLIPNPNLASPAAAINPSMPDGPTSTSRTRKGKITLEEHAAKAQHKAEKAAGGRGGCRMGCAAA